MVKTFTNRRPDDWQTKQFWQDDGLYYHPVDPSEPDVFKTHSPVPQWVKERRGESRDEGVKPLIDGKGVKL